MPHATAQGEWMRLDGLRRAFLTRCEKYARLTLPRICPPDHYEQTNTELSHDYQSVGAQATNHLANRLMLTMFAPSRPFFRQELPGPERQKLIDAGIKSEAIDKALATGERRAIREMDRRPIRPKLFEAMLHLIITGNNLLYLPEGKNEEARTFGIKEYVVRRTGDGRVKRLIVRECLKFDELDEGVQRQYLIVSGLSARADSEVHLYRDVSLEGDRMVQRTWVNNVHIGGKYDGNWPVERCPWKVLVWNLSDRADYGTGHVEDYAGDFSALSALSQAQVEGAILASEFRWLCNPAGMTKPEDVEASSNGAVLPGIEGDLSLIANSKASDLKVVADVNSDYVRRIGNGFLLASATQRDAERVTAAEIRRDAMELETALGGVYTRLSIGLQKPVALWLMRSIDMSIDGTKIEVYVVTGLDALSRNGDLDALRAALQDIALLQGIDPDIRAALKLDRISATIFMGHGLDNDEFVKSPDERAADQAATQQAERDTLVTEAAAQQAARQQGPA